MKRFVKIFNNAMELSCLGLYEKVQNVSKQESYKYSLLLKKSLDKFSLLNIAYLLFDKAGNPLLPTDEAALIKRFNHPIKNLIDKLPNEFKELLCNSEWYSEDNFINIGSDNCYYCTPDLLDKLNNDRLYRKANNSPYKELELESQKFIELLFERTQEEYCEIRSFLEQKEHAFITSSMFIENEYIREFRNKYPQIFEAAYEKLNYDNVHLKICHHCGLVLKEMSDGTLYCVSDRCSRKSKGFTIYKEEKINDDRIWVLRLNVSRYIYYPGLLEQDIKKALEKAGTLPVLWPDKDTWDFKFELDGKTCVIDAKDVKNPSAIQEDIKLKQKQGVPYDYVLYVVPSDRNKIYLQAVRRVIEDKEKIQCITFADFKRLINEKLEVVNNETLRS